MNADFAFHGTWLHFVVLGIMAFRELTPNPVERKRLPLLCSTSRFFRSEVPPLYFPVPKSRLQPIQGLSKNGLRPLSDPRFKITIDKIKSISTDKDTIPEVMDMESFKR